MNRFYLVAVIALFPNFAFAQTPDCGLERRAVYDIGSGSTKLRVADIDTCSNSISRMVFTRHERVGYQAAVEASPERRIDPATEARGRSALLRLKAEMQAAVQPAPQVTLAVATAAFRTAGNAPEVAERLSEVIDAPIRIISQTEEGQLSFVAAVVTAGLNAFSALVWDMGGGSQQFATHNQVFNIRYGAESLVADFMRARRAGTLEATPNPLSAEDMAVAIETASEQEKATLQGNVLELRDVISSAHSQVLGVGGVLARSLADQFNRTPGFEHVRQAHAYTRQDIERLIATRAGLDDTALRLILDDPYYRLHTTNFLMVLGAMRALGIERVRYVDCEMSDGALVLH